MNQHDEQQVGSTEHATAAPATGDGPLDVPEQAEPGDGTSGVTGPSAAAIPPTGDDRVDEALTRLAELDRLDVTEHAGVVEEVHRALQDTLAEEED